MKIMVISERFIEFFPTRNNSGFDNVVGIYLIIIRDYSSSEYQWVKIAHLGKNDKKLGIFGEKF